MKRTRTVLFLLLTGLCLPVWAHASIDFYGVKMPSESYAKNLRVESSNQLYTMKGEAEGVDKSVYAYGTWKQSWQGPVLNIRIFNNSDSPILADYDFIEYTVVTQDGQRHNLEPPVMTWYSGSIKPKKSETFEPALGALNIKKEDITHIICSFDMGSTKIVLVPVPKSAAPVTAAKPVPAPAAQKPVIAKPEPPKPAAPKTAVSKPVITSKPSVAPVAAKPATIKETPKTPEPVKPKAAVIAAKPAAKPAPPPVSKKITGTNITPANVAKKKEEVSDRPNLDVRVIEVYAADGFFILSGGLIEGFERNMMVNIYRSGRFIGRAAIRKVRDHASAAILIPELMNEPVAIGDSVRISTYA